MSLFWTKNRSNLVTQSALQAEEQRLESPERLHFFGKVAADIFSFCQSCDKHLLSGVTLRFSVVRSKPEFALIYDGNVKFYIITLSQANCYVRKMTESDQVFSAFEKILKKNTCRLSLHWNFTRVKSTSLRKLKFEQRGCVQQGANKTFFSGFDFRSLDSKLTNPFQYQKHGLSEVTAYRNGYPIARTPISTDDEKRVYMTTMVSLAFGYPGHGIPFTRYTNHFVLVFDHTSTQQASHDFFYPELTNAAVSLGLKFSAALPTNTEVCLLGAKASTIYFDSNRKMAKDVILNPATWK